MKKEKIITIKQVIVLVLIPENKDKNISYPH